MSLARLPFGIVAILVGIATPSLAAPPPALLPPLPILPSVARVKVRSHPAERTIEVIEEINLPRGEWKNELLRFHIAFGSPGPKAIDVHLVPVGDGLLEPEDDEIGETIATERVPRRPATAYSLVGREVMAGILVTIRPESFTKALARGNMAALRIRSLADTTTEGEDSVVVRLGSSRGTPLTLGRIVASGAPFVRAEAKLCGPEAAPHLLAIGLSPKVAPTDPQQAPIAPVLAVRHASDDLCVRLVHAVPIAAPKN